MPKTHDYRVFGYIKDDNGNIKVKSRNIYGVRNKEEAIFEFKKKVVWKRPLFAPFKKPTLPKGWWYKYKAERIRTYKPFRKIKVKAKLAMRTRKARR